MTAKVLLFLTSLVLSSTAFAFEIEYVADFTLSFNQQFQKTTVGGLSSLIFDATKDGFYSLSDDRGRINESRFYFLNFKLKTDKDKKVSFEVEPKEVIFIDQNKKEKEALDPESFIQLPSGNFLIGSEGDNKTKPRLKPRLLEVTAQGKWIRDITVPSKFIPESTGLQMRGIRNNNGFEGMSLAPSGKWFLVGTEETLIQDGLDSNFKVGGTVRFIKYEISGEKIQATAEWAYQLDPVEQQGLTSKVVGSGVSEILFVSEDQFLVLERATVIEFGKYTDDLKLFLVTLGSQDDVSSQPTLSKKVKTLAKKLILDFDTILPLMNDPKDLDNLEAIAFGPKLPDGRKTLLFGSDNNFQSIQRSLFLLFAVKSR
ncbi:MAG: esterase-like activity of phytase family protein [Pseudobdellovibrionaceae bacterium]